MGERQDLGDPYGVPTGAVLRPAAEWRCGTGPASLASRPVVQSSANESQVSGSHYKDMKIQVWDYCHANGLGGIETMVVKYISRWRKKGGLADLEKAKHCIEKLIELERP